MIKIKKKYTMNRL